MQYTFNSRVQHNFQTVFARHLPRFIWPVIVTAVVKIFFSNTEFAKSNLPYYFLLLVELGNFYTALTEDSISSLTIDVSKKQILFLYYNMYEGRTEKVHPFSIINCDIISNKNAEAEQIVFFIRKKREFTIKKEKDQFLKEDMNSLAELLINLTSPKNI